MKRYYLVQVEVTNGRLYASVPGVGYDGECPPPERVTYLKSGYPFREKWIDSLEKAKEYASRINSNAEPVKVAPKVEYTKEEAQEIINDAKFTNNSGYFDCKLDGDTYDSSLARAGFDEAESDLIMAALVMAGVKFVFKE